VLDRTGDMVRAPWTVPHDAAGLQALVAALLEPAGGDPTRVAIGLEVPRGAVVDVLLERGLAV
jgi:hypothetical protein